MSSRFTWKNIFGGKNSPKTANAIKPEKKRIYHRIKKHRQYQADMEMDKLGSAVDAALDTENPNYEDLYSLYDQASRDRHLKSQVGTAINDIQQSPYIVEVDGTEDEDLKGLFDAAWFDDFIEFAAAAEFWGHSLIEFPKVNENQVFDECYLLPRENVDPARKRIILNRDDELYLPYEDMLSTLNLIEVKGKERLGLYEVTTEEVILKKYARTDWSQASEKYGMPFLDIETDIADKKELDAIENAAANFAANGYFIHGTETKATIQQAAKGDFYKIYLEAIELANKELSKSVNGQSATADNQAYVGASEVQERIKNVFTKARLRRMQNHVNGMLIPLMIANGYKMADKLAKAKFLYTDLMDLEPQLITDPEEEEEEEGEGGGEGGGTGEGEGEGGGTQARLGVKKKSGRKSLVSAGSLFNPKAVDETLTGYLDQVKMGTGVKIEKTSYSNPRFSMYSNLQADASRFAVFREAQKQREVNAARTDLDRAKIEKRYKEYYATEKHAIFGNAAAAERWAGFAENADLYPNLEWRTAGDADVRDEHAILEGLVLPINDPFWSTHTPPLGWGCRCEVIQTDEKVNSGNAQYKGVEQNTPAPRGFDFNPGVEQKLFSDQAGYYTSASKEAAEILNKESLSLSGMVSKARVLKDYPQKGNVFKLKQIEGHKEIKVYKGDIRDISYKYHENKTLRNYLVYDLKNVLKDAKLVSEAPEGKGRTQYAWWYYLKVQGFDKMYLNVAKMKSGELKLHAITATIEKK